MPDNAKPAYDESSIKPLDGIEHVRLRPAMYIGGTDKKALHHLVFEAMDVSVDEALAGKCSQIEITIFPGEEIRITDNSEGLSVAIRSHRNPPVSVLELQMTTIGCGAPYSARYSVQGGLHGVGLPAVNALCAIMVAQVRRDGFLWQQRYAAARPQTLVEQIRPLNADESTGNTFVFTPDFTIMDPNQLDFDLIAARCREVAHTVAGLRLTLRDERVSPAREQVFHAPQGIRARLAELKANAQPMSSVFYRAAAFQTSTDPRRPILFRIQIAFQYTDIKHTQLESYVNTIPSTGGTHVNGFRRGMLELLSDCLLEYGISNSQYIEQGLSAVINVFHNWASFESQSKIVLLNPEIEESVASMMSELFQTHFQASQKLIEYLKSRQS